MRYYKTFVIMVIALMIFAAPAWASETTGTANSTETVVSPTPTPGSSFDVPVVVPGVNMVVTFTLDNNGQIAAVAVSGAPAGAIVATGSDGAKITFQDGGTTRTVEVSADVETKNGQVVQVKTETEVSVPENKKETTETPEPVGDEHQAKVEHETEVQHNSDTSTQENAGDQKPENDKIKSEDHANSAPDLPRQEGQNTSGGDTHQADQGDQD